MRDKPFRASGLGLMGAALLAGGAWAQSVPMSSQDVADLEAAQQQQDMDAAEDLAQAMDDQARADDQEARARWQENENNRLALCRGEINDAIKEIEERYEDEIARMRAGDNPHAADHIKGLQGARDQVIKSVIDEQCRPPHEQRRRDAESQPYRPMPVITPPPVAPGTAPQGAAID